MARSAVSRFTFERALWARGVQYVAGVDEAGRGPLAGPVVAAAVILPMRWSNAGLPGRLRGLNDSKQLAADERERFFAVLTSDPEIHYSVAQVDAELIDQINILQATHRAMRLALTGLNPPPEFLLVDGLPVHALPCPHEALIDGDARSYSIAAASVIAKVTRDRLMEAFDEQWPHYGFADHKGYSTPQHRAALREYGPCLIHRHSFAPLHPEELELPFDWS